MENTWVRFGNKLEIRYHFEDKSNCIDALIRHRCEKEVINVLRALAELLGVKMTIYADSCENESDYKERWAIAGESSRAISILVNIFMQLMSRPTLSVGGQLLADYNEETDLRLQKSAGCLRRDLRQKKAGSVIPSDLIDLLSASPRYRKCKSNFYEALRGYPKVSRISMRELNDKNRGRSGVLEIKRDHFNLYILRSDDLPTIKDTKATIEIISPVLKDSKYRWKGIYNKGGETIDFYMRDEDFKQQMFDEKIAFSSGMCIDCVLEIERRLSEMGEVIPTCYTVTTVIRTRLDKLVIVTPQGKRHLRKIEAEKQQLTLDFFG